MNRRALVATCAIVVAVPAGAQTIDELAPRNTMLIMGVDDFSVTEERFRATPLHDMWTAEEMAEIHAQWLPQLEKGLRSLLGPLGLGDDDPIPTPQGAVGFAMFPVIDSDLGVVKPGLLAIAEFGEDAGRVAEMIEAAMREGRESGQVQFAEKELLGRRVFAIDVPKVDAAELEQLRELGDPTEFLSQIETIHWVREKGHILAAAEMSTLLDVLETFDGKTRATVGKSATFRAVESDLGATDGYMMLFVDNAFNMMAGPDNMGLAMIQPMMHQLVGDVQAIGAGMRLDGEQAMVEQAFSIFMPDGTEGLTALLDTAGPLGPVPAFVGPDTLSYSSFNFEFDGVMDLVRPMMQMAMGMMGEVGADGDAQMQASFDMADMVLGGLGPDVHVVMNETDNIAGNAFAIRSSQPNELASMLEGMAPMMGMEFQEIGGRPMYSMDPAMLGAMMPMQGVDAVPTAPGLMQPMAIGIGTEYIVLGTVPLVESSLHGAGKSAPTLSSDAEFKRAMGVLGEGPVVAWGFSRTVDALEAQLETQREMMETLLDQMPDDIGEEAAAQARAAAWPLMLDIDYDFLRRHIGPSAWSMRVSKRGFSGRSYLLAP